MMGGRQWLPTEENFSNVKGEVHLSDEEYHLFLGMLPPGWRLMECTGLGDDSGSDDPEGSSSRVGAAAAGRGGGRGRRGRGRGAQAASAASTGSRRTSGRGAAAEERAPEPQARKRRRSAGAEAPAADAKAPKADEELLRQQIERGVEQLSQEQLDKVIDFLKDDLTDENGDGTDFALDIDALPLHRRHAMLEFVELQLRGEEAPAAPVTPAAPSNGAAPPAAARRSHAWEVCSAREMQKHHHLREVEERASVAGTPSMTPKEKPVAGDELAEAPLPPPAAVAGQGDSMLDNCEEVLSMLEDFSWM